MIIRDGLHTMVISEVLGFYLIIMAIIMVAKNKFYRDLLLNLQPNSGYIQVSASFALFIGLFMIIIHNTWVMGNEVIVTLVAWIITIKSLLWLSIPGKMSRLAKNIYAGYGYFIVTGIMFIVGILLLAHNHHHLVP